MGTGVDPWSRLTGRRTRTTETLISWPTLDRLPPSQGQLLCRRLRNSPFNRCILRMNLTAIMGLPKHHCLVDTTTTINNNRFPIPTPPPHHQHYPYIPISPPPQLRLLDMKHLYILYAYLTLSWISVRKWVSGRHSNACVRQTSHRFTPSAFTKQKYCHHLHIIFHQPSSFSCKLQICEYHLLSPKSLNANPHPLKLL